MATTGCDGVIAIDSNTALAAPGNAADELAAAASFPVGLSEEPAVLTGRLIDPVAEYAAVITLLGTKPKPAL
jgi:hypothetical protein